MTSHSSPPASASTPISTVMADAQWLAHRYDPVKDMFHMLQALREKHGQIPFLTDEYLGAAKPLGVRRSDAMANAAAPAPLHFIFHSAYCCSTLLAAALDIPGVSMGLKEPVVLNDIVGWRHRGASGPDAARVLDAALALLARPFSPGEAVVIKPSNLINPLIPAMLTMRPQAHALLLYAPLDAYLASIARKGMWGRLWVRDLLRKLLREGLIDLGIAAEDYLGLTDIQVAAVGWLAQQAHFQRLITQFGDRIATLNSEALVRRPTETLEKLAAHFSLEIGRKEAERIAGGPVFSRDAKTGAGFARDQRGKDAQRGLELHREEIEKVSEWARVIADNVGVNMTLDRPLI